MGSFGSVEGTTGSAHSRGDRDKLVESFGWSIPSEGLAGSGVEKQGDLVEVGLALIREVGAFGEELPRQAVPVLVGPPLPWCVRVAEENRDPAGDSEAGVRSELVALIPSEGACQ